MSRREAARVLWCGVVEEVRDHLLRAHGAHLDDGFGDWQRFRFGELGLDDVELDGDEPVLWLTTPDAKATLQGFTKYQATWKRAMIKHFGREVELCPRRTEAA